MATTKRAAAKQTFTARTPFGEFTRTSTRAYVYCVARADGWHQFSQSLAAAQRELRFQQGRGRTVVLVPAEVAVADTCWCGCGSLQHHQEAVPFDGEGSDGCAIGVCSICLYPYSSHDATRCRRDS